MKDEPIALILGMLRASAERTMSVAIRPTKSTIVVAETISAIFNPRGKSLFSLVLQDFRTGGVSVKHITPHRDVNLEI
jgi:hypothetical protein